MKMLRWLLFYDYWLDSFRKKDLRKLCDRWSTFWSWSWIRSDPAYCRLPLCICQMRVWSIDSPLFTSRPDTLSRLRVWTIYETKEVLVSRSFLRWHIILNSGTFQMLKNTQTVRKAVSRSEITSSLSYACVQNLSMVYEKYSLWQNGGKIQ